MLNFNTLLKTALKETVKKKNGNINIECALYIIYSILRNKYTAAHRTLCHSFYHILICFTTLTGQTKILCLNI